ncbi:MAG TPA: amidohydrolase family protein [Frankiaceae bacterium]|jgi:predicted TIM-barrel fold metal-dependent hydrolase|nr:amidohydrolase family protein [Frankiaceae bacterium]
MELSYRTVDADNHYYETRDAFSRYIDPAFASRTLRVETDAGDDRIVIDGLPYVFSEPKFDKTNPPGSLLANLRDPQRKAYASTFDASNMLAAFQNRDKRLELMDTQGVEAAILLPSLAVCVERPIRQDPALTDAVMRAFNRWLEDDWGYAYQNRIFGVPLISLLDVGLACRELTRVLDQGARMIHLSAGPVAGKSPADPHFDSFWSIVNEARIPVVFHIGDAGYSELFGAAWGENPTPRVREMSAFQWAFLHGDLPLMQTLGSLVYYNLFGRFPHVKVVSIENGSDWAFYLLKHLDKKKGMGRQGPWPGGYFRGRPSEILKEHLYLTPYPEDDVLPLVELMGADHVLFGSDYPHPEGLAEPNAFADLLDGLDAAAVRRIMVENSRELLGAA